MKSRLPTFLVFSLHLLLSTQHLSFAGPPQDIAPSACADVKSKLGQLLYITVDGFGDDTTQAIHPEYLKVVQELNPGGVLPRFGTQNYNHIREATAALQAAAKDPLLIGVDYAAVNFTARSHAPNMVGPPHEVTFGLGYGGGKIAELNSASEKSCFEKLMYLEAFLHHALGLNQSLGPTLEQNRKWGYLNNSPDKIMDVANPLFKSFRHFGVATTMKHFPYTPETFNLHDDNADTRIPSDEVKTMIQIFKEAASKTDFAMTTHILNTNVDPDDMATFSKKWIGMLRNDVGFDGILMTDALFMIQYHPKSIQAMSRKWNAKLAAGLNNQDTVFAVRAILAGHDMVFLDGSAAKHRQVFKELGMIACLDDALGRDFRARIAESSSRILSYKKKNSKTLTASVEVPQSLFDQAGILYKRLNYSVYTGLACPHADFDALKPQLEALGLAAFPDSPAPNFSPPNPNCAVDPKSLQPIDPNQIGPLYKVRDAVSPRAEQHDFEDH